jgi:hypothetical protein
MVDYQGNNIEQLMEILPSGYEEACFETKAMERNRIIKGARNLMILCLIYLLESHKLIAKKKLAQIQKSINLSMRKKGKPEADRASTPIIHA